MSTGRRLAWLGLAGLVALGLAACAAAPDRPDLATAALPTERLDAESVGTGPPLLLLHGFGASRYTWRHLAAPLARHHRVILVDLRGFGRSPKPLDARYTVHDQAALVTRLIVEEDLRGLTLVGHSFGGAVALATALTLREQGPDRLAGLILIGVPAYRQATPGFIRVLQTPLVGPLALWLLPARFQARRILALAYREGAPIPEDAVTAYAEALAIPAGRHAVVRTARQLPPPDVDEAAARYPTLDVPTLLLWGRHDRIVPVAVGERLQRALPRAELVVLEGSGHVPQEEEPGRVLEAIEAFLARRP